MRPERAEVSADFEAAENLFDAYRTGRQTSLVSEDHAFSEETAYHVQREIVARKVGRLNETLIGYKISMTSAETQGLVGANEPVYGTLTNRNVLASPATLKLADLNGPLVEAELVFSVSKTLSTAPTDGEILSCCDVHVAIEVPDSRYEDWFPRLKLIDLMCDCAACHSVIVGTKLSALRAERFANLMMVVNHDGVEVVSGTGEVVLGSPLNAVRWLACKLGVDGRRLEAGAIVSSGTFVPPIKARAGTFLVQLEDLGEAAVTFEA